jgi:hypothetical protein
MVSKSTFLRIQAVCNNSPLKIYNGPSIDLLHSLSAANILHQLPLRVLLPDVHLSGYAAIIRVIASFLSLLRSTLTT